MNCLRCGYDLSHTPTDVACTECGLAAERSVIARNFQWWQLIMLVLAGFFILCPTLSFFRLRWLAKRLGRHRLAEHIGIVAGGSGLTLATCLFVMIPAAGTIRHAGTTFTLLVVLPAALFGLFTLWSLLLLLVICPLFFRSAIHARRKWIAADASRSLAIAPPQPASR